MVKTREMAPLNDTPKSRSRRKTVGPMGPMGGRRRKMKIRQLKDYPESRSCRKIMGRLGLGRLGGTGKYAETSDQWHSKVSERADARLVMLPAWAIQPTLSGTPKSRSGRLPGWLCWPHGRYSLRSTALQSLGAGGCPALAAWAIQPTLNGTPKSRSGRRPGWLCWPHGRSSLRSTAGAGGCPAGYAGRMGDTAYAQRHSKVSESGVQNDN